MLAIREAAVERWGFSSTALGGDQIIAMEKHVGVSELDARLIDLHRPRLSADDAAKIAEFYETESGQRLIASNLEGMLPSSDPLVRNKPSRPAESDTRVFEAFLATPAGVRLNAVSPALTKEILDAQDALANLAVERYVVERKLPNRRKPATGTGSR